MENVEDSKSNAMMDVQAEAAVEQFYQAIQSVQIKRHEKMCFSIRLTEQTLQEV